MGTVVKIDARVCVKQEENGLTVNRQDISIPDSIEVLRRIQNVLRHVDMIGDDDLAYEVFAEQWLFLPAAEGEALKVCIAFDPLHHKIQFTATGLKYWDVCTLLEMACAYLNALQLGIIQE